MSEAVEESIVDSVDPARAAALFATLGLGDKDKLPPFGHLIYFWAARPDVELGHDGHAELGGLIPDLGMPHRMWAGGRLQVHGVFKTGIRAERISRRTAVTQKEGKSGKLAFVTLRHEVRQRGFPVLTEDQDIVYREVATPPSDPPMADQEPDQRVALKLSAATLFRYSALTFNAHRIHYDVDYCRDQGYSGLIVHGPLLATCLAAMADAHLGGLKHFSFRATAPLFLDDVAWLCRSGSHLWVEGPRRKLCMVAEAQ